MASPRTAGSISEITRGLLKELLPQSLAPFADRWRDKTAPEARGFRVFELEGWPAGRIHDDWCHKLEAAGLCSDGTFAIRASAVTLGQGDASELFRHVCQRLLALNQLPGYRDELHTVFDPQGLPVCAIERALFKILGLRSQAVHVHAQTANGLIWTARRSLSKHENPGMYDNLAAGGIAASESAEQCALRECDEEAGLVPDCLEYPTTEAVPPLFALLGTVAKQGQDSGLATASTTPNFLVKALDAGWSPLEVNRPLKTTWHHELIWPVWAQPGKHWAPHNRDGEVGGFELTTPEACLDLVNRWQFTPDAGLVTAFALAGKTSNRLL